MRNLFLIILFIFVLIPASWAFVAADVNHGNDLYRHGQFDDSLKLYQKALDKDDTSPVVKYDLGTALYKKGDYAKALDYLVQALQDKNIKIKPKAEYNLGNVLFKTGMQKANTNVDDAIKNLQEALGDYGQALTDDPKDQDALFNQDFVKKEIERLKQKKQQQQQEQNKQNQQNQKNQQNQQKQQNQQNQQKQQNQQEKEHSQQNNPKDQKNQNAASKAQQQKEALDKAEKNQKEIDRKQAQDLLEDYQENEEPKKLLNYMPKKIDDRPVLKDW